MSKGQYAKTLGALNFGGQIMIIDSRASFNLIDKIF